MKKILFIVVMLVGIISYSQDRYRGAKRLYDLDKQVGDSTVSRRYYRTSDSALYHGDKYPVYVTKRGRLFIWTTRDGNSRRIFIR